MLEALRNIKKTDDEYIKIAKGKYQYPKTFIEAIRKAFEQGKDELKKR
jgi:hypothetical protein